jgi:hypothetical protein
MKFLTSPALSALTNCISQREVGDVTYDGRVELYSLKETGDDHRLKKELEEVLAEEEGLRRDRSTSFSVAIADLQSSPVSSDTERAPFPAQRVPSHTPAVDHRSLYFLISTLNASYPDYDFRCVRRPSADASLGGDSQEILTPPPPQAPPPRQLCAHRHVLTGHVRVWQC